MKRFLLCTAAACVLATTLATGAADARPRHNPPHHAAYRWHDHSDWRKGGYVARNDWDRGQHIDYRSAHLRAPPRGYEWRRVDNNYVLAAVTTGLIASVILNNH